MAVTPMMLYRTHLAAMLKLETLLKNVCAEKERMIHHLTEENKRLQARVDLVELRLFPAPQVPKDKPTEPVVEAGESSWQSFLNKHCSEIEEAERKAREKTDGVPN